MNYWLVKSEPFVYSFDQLLLDGQTRWDGVRNYQARNFMRAMAVGDLVVIYHSNAEPSGIAGLAEVARTAYPDHTAWDAASPYHDPKDGPAIARWSMVDVRFVAEAKRFLPLDQLRAEPQLADMLLFSLSRLSVQPVEDRHLAWIRSAAGM